MQNSTNIKKTLMKRSKKPLQFPQSIYSLADSDKIHGFNTQ